MIVSIVRPLTLALIFVQIQNKPVQTRFCVLAKNTFKAKATIKTPTGIACGATENGSVKPMNRRYKSLSV